ncbi:MAG: SpoIID/LytB domain-containing protein [Thermoanaerobaculaceae bacterium]|nr:SpoIID/LytB domain-containing protein [Thermoanaerobaculaceae bacterium]
MTGPATRLWRLLPALAFAALGCAVGPQVAAPVVPGPAPSPTPQAWAPPPAAPVAAPAPPAPFAAAPPCALPARADVGPPQVRVLLTVPPGPVLPEPGRRYACVVGDAPAVLLRGPITATAPAGPAQVQVGAFGNEANAAAVVARLAAAGFEGAVAEPKDALIRVVAVGREGEDTATLAGRLRAAGFPGQAANAPASGEVVLAGEGGATVRGPRVLLVPLDPDPVRVGAKAVRGEIELRPGAGGVAVINVLNLEAYLRGVVPAEMGPRAFPLLEALKAQAVAARTYAVAHLGEHAPEGYDLCDSPACQAYEGVEAEQPLTDRAVRETEGEIVTYLGRPIDAMYHSTCAGHTEDGGALFPARAAPYLKGVPCRGERTLAAGVSSPRGPWLGPVERLATVGRSLAEVLGCAASPHPLAARLAGAQPGPGVAGIVAAFAVPATAATLHVAHGRTAEDTALDLLRLFRLPLPPSPRGDRQAAWEVALVVRLGQLAGTVQTHEGRLVPGPSGLRLVLDGDAGTRDIPRAERVLERRGERWRDGPVEFSAGSRATLWCAAGTCPVLEVEALEDADAGSSWTWWVREFSLDELGARLGVAGVRAVSVTARGVSGRALSVSVSGRDGSKEFGGMAFRRALDLPDTLFVVTWVRTGSAPRARFLGRGWGHGVGMCQNGAYGLARGGAGYVEILKTYYTGVEVTRWQGGKR